jgi:hypothetical protein
MRAIGFFLLLLGVSEAQAQWSFSLDPASTVIAGGQEVALRIDEAGGCFLSNIINVTRDGSTIAVVANIEDTIPVTGCPPAWLTPRFVSLGTFTPGLYEVQVTVCTNPPPPLPECQLQATLPLTVLGVSGTKFTVPTMSGTVAVGLAFALMAIAALVARRE